MASYPLCRVDEARRYGVISPVSSRRGLEVWRHIFVSSRRGLEVWRHIPCVESTRHGGMASEVDLVSTRVGGEVVRLVH